MLRARGSRYPWGSARRALRSRSQPRPVHAAIRLAELGPTAAILIIGEEILSGKVEEENARFLVQELRGLGVSVRRIEVLPDIVEEIAAVGAGAVGALRPRVHLGRRGPHPRRRHPAGGGRRVRDGRRPPARAGGADPAQPWAPSCTSAICAWPTSPRARACCTAIRPTPARWPVVAVHNVYVLPGVPPIFRRKFEACASCCGPAPIFSRALYSREGEGPIAAALDTVVAEFPSGDHRLVPTHRRRRPQGEDHPRRPRRGGGRAGAGAA